ncbi:hypothetical protein [Dysgonomonas sp. ZJ709]|uniref:hypothetical protein n=1 Tax=Dysgonomonas sp. ZJ709 TaxID=2709797 RepID=UPI0013EE2E57|nr:hypothetical protein [Dysgonomonas sp. ZJ709]
MKTLIVTLLLMCSIGLNAQTSTSKYNSTLKRYEYFDSSGNMIGYEKYNTYLKQWEYTDTQKENQSSGYIQPYDTDMIYDMARRKQEAYDSNRDLVQSKVNELGEFINWISEENGGLTTYQQKRVNEINSQIFNTTKGVDFSNRNVTTKLLNWIDRLITEVSKWSE